MSGQPGFRPGTEPTSGFSGVEELAAGQAAGVGEPSGDVAGAETELEGRNRPAIPARWQTAWAWLVCRVVEYLYLNPRVVGRKAVPRRGPVILAGNHTGLADGPLVLGAAPRRVHFIMKYSLGRGIGGFFLRAGGQVALQRDSGHQALRVCLELLRRGRAVGIFPEGSRGDGRMRQIKAGVAWLAISSGAPVVPFACLGTRHDGEAATRFPPPRRKVYVSFGAPVELVLDKSASRREQIGAAMEQIRLALAAHVAKALEESPVGLPDDTGRVNS